MTSPFNLAFSVAILVPVLAVRERRHPYQAFRVQKLGITATSTKPEVYALSESSKRLGTMAGTDVYREWSNATFPNPIRDPFVCGTKVGSHICDPESILSSAVLDAQDMIVQRFETNTKSEYCAGTGYSVYIGIVHSLTGTEGLHKVANDLGHQWGVLGTPCSNGIVALVSLQDGGNLAIEVDEKLKDRMFPGKLVDHLERTPLGVLELRSPDDVIMSLVSELDLVLDGSFSSRRTSTPWIMDDRTMMFFYAPVGFLGLVLSFLFLCCLYDTVSHWCHRARFSSCARKLQRVHEVFLSSEAELPLCPICVNSVTNAPSSRVVVFLCGHRFHTDCSNRWFREHHGMSGRCPICELPHSYSCGDCADNSLMCESRSTASSPVNSADEIKSFFLSSLQRTYPDIIPESSVERWNSCHTEIWLSELKCPRYQTLFDKSLFGKKAPADHLPSLPWQPSITHSV